ncbi:MAG: hypothetical protein CTY36_00300 [Methylocystis sp.]|nr:MAG: hypothetical protein CTY36_00300 [Methylocystis sp.]
MSAGRETARSAAPSQSVYAIVLAAARATQASADFPRMRAPRETRIKLLAYLAMTRVYPDASRAEIATGLGLSLEEAVEYLAPLRLDRAPRWLTREDLDACIAALDAHAPTEATRAKPKCVESRPPRRFEIDVSAPRDLVRTRLICVAPSRRAARLLAERFDGPRREEGAPA